MTNQNLAHRSALQFYLDHGVDEALLDAPADKFSVTMATPDPITAPQQTPQISQPAPAPTTIDPVNKTLSRDLAAKAETLDDLKEIIMEFDELAIKKTATNMVFADGDAKARVMVIGDAPGADEDRTGKPFVGMGGQLLDKILACIDLDRNSDDPKTGAYLTNILNWRPPGNRTASPIEIETCLPFIEKHIALVKPDFLILCGSVPAKALLNNKASLSKLRGTFHDYLPQTLEDQSPIPAIVTYHPDYLIRTPGQKKAVWNDMLSLKEEISRPCR